MCGICGIISPEGHQQVDVLHRMVALLAHRGPDDSGVWSNVAAPRGPATARSRASAPCVALGHTRLAILDLSPAGHQPMGSDDGRLWITFNGEIYNFKELRAELTARGHRFRSATDTEVILHLYEEEGPRCVEQLEGMFAFAIWDSGREELFLARDPFGVKPLYYVQNGAGLAFASEIKALLELADTPREVDLEALHQYLTFLWVPDPRTMFRGIHKLPAGHSALFKGGELRLHQYWDLPFPLAEQPFERGLDELVEEVRSRFRRAVTGQMVSDVPVGAFLSSGLDSTAIVAMMAEASAQPVSTYTIAFPPSYRRGEVTLDDTDVARRVAERFGCRHTELVVEPDVVELLPQIVWHLDEPIADPAAITAYLVCREAKATATVLLSGVGGDELFAGYRKHRAHALAQRYRQIPAPVRHYFIEPFVEALPALRGTPLKGYVRLAKKMARGGSLPPQERFLMDSTYLREEEKQALYTAPLQAELVGRDPWQRHREHFARVSDADFLNQMLYLDTKAFMVSLNLTYNDKMSMASAVEVRVPFLDTGLAEFVAREVPPSLKLRGSTTKYIFRQAMEGILPREVLEAPKAGFGAPVDYWLAGALRPMVDELLAESTVRRRGYFDPRFVRRMVEEQRSGRRDWSYQIWQLLTFELWLQSFIDGSPRAQPTPAARMPAAAGAALSRTVGSASCDR